MQGLDSHQASRVAERMRLAIHACKGARFTSVAQITASFGVSGVEHGARTAAELVDQADKALPTAKQSGRDQVTRRAGHRMRPWRPHPCRCRCPRCRPSPPRPALPTPSRTPINWIRSGTIHEHTGPPAAARSHEAGHRARAPLWDRSGGDRTRRGDGSAHRGSLLGFAESEKLVTAAMAQLRNPLRSSDSVTYADEAALGLTVSQLGSGEFVVLLTDIGHPESITWVIRRIFSCLGRPDRAAGQRSVPDAAHRCEHVPRRRRGSRWPAKPGAFRPRRGEGGAGDTDAFVFFSTEMNRRAREQFHLEGLLYRAIERGELYLEYQPRVDLRSGRDQRDGGAAEVATARGRSRISPEIFVALAEHTGLIDSIGEWVLRTACRQAKAWRDCGHPGGLGLREPVAGPAPASGRGRTHPRDRGRGRPSAIRTDSGGRGVPS